MEDFIPWNEPSGALHFHVVINGVPHAARVTRECLTEHALMDETTTREQFAASATADQLRRMAAAKIGKGDEPFITRDDWQ
jgi:hypothetical protein